MLIKECIDKLDKYVELCILLNEKIDLIDYVDKLNEMKTRPEVILVNGKYKINLDKYPEYGL